MSAVLRADAGELVELVAARAIREARRTGQLVTFEHNGVEVEAHADSRIYDLRTIWRLRRQLLRSAK